MPQNGMYAPPAMKMMKAIEAALTGRDGVDEPGFAHMPNNGMYAPPAENISATPRTCQTRRTQIPVLQ